MWDPTGTIITELRETTAVAALVSDHIRGGHPAPGIPGSPGGPAVPGDKRPKGSWLRFLVITREGAVRSRGRQPVQTVTLGIRCYGTSPKDAAALMGVVSDALHQQGPRAGSGGGHIWLSLVGESQGADLDPTTDQPFEDVYVDVICTT